MFGLWGKLSTCTFKGVLRTTINWERLLSSKSLIFKKVVSQRCFRLHVNFVIGLKIFLLLSTVEIRNLYYVVAGSDFFGTEYKLLPSQNKRKKERKKVVSRFNHKIKYWDTIFPITWKYKKEITIWEKELVSHQHTCYFSIEVRESSWWILDL